MALLKGKLDIVHFDTHKHTVWQQCNFNFVGLNETIFYKININNLKKGLITFHDDE